MEDTVFSRSEYVWSIYKLQGDGIHIIWYRISFNIQYIVLNLEVGPKNQVEQECKKMDTFLQ